MRFQPAASRHGSLHVPVLMADSLLLNSGRDRARYESKEPALMLVKRILILAPIIVIGVLLQSYFWVPSYDAQTIGNPDRVWMYIKGSAADAKILNPILNADTSSSDIVSLIFEGLLDLDETLQLRGRLATDWEISENVYLAVHRDGSFPDGSPVTTVGLEKRITRAMAGGSLHDLVTRVEVIPAETRTEKVTLLEGRKPVPVVVKIRFPERLKLSLNRVDQDLFQKLEPLLGKEYGATIDWHRRVIVDPPEKLAAVLPRLSDILSAVEHNPIILFNLRKGVLFHDGHEFDSGDVKFTYEAIMNPKNLSPRTSDFEPIKAVEILDRYRVRVVYKRLFSPAINAWTMGILPEHLLKDDALQREMDQRGLSEVARENFGMRDSRFNRHPIGVGPFRFVAWYGDELISLRRYDDYWEGPPLYERFVTKVIPDTVTREVEFRSGAVDAYVAQPHQAARYKKDKRYQVFSMLSRGYSYIGYNNRRELFKDPRVRRALGMAINTDEIIKYVMYNEAKRVTGPYPEQTRWYNHAVKPIPYDPEGALRILRDLGWQRNRQGWLEKEGKIFEFNLITNNGNPVRKEILAIAQNSWSRIGIKCNTQLFEWAVFLEDFINKLDFDAVVLGWSMGIDPDLYQIWSSQEAGPYQLNFVGYDNPRADVLIERIRREYDVPTQVRLAHALHRTIAEDQPYTFLFAPLATQVFDKKIVMVEDGVIKPIRAEKAGVQFHFTKWRKLAAEPEFSTQ